MNRLFVILFFGLEALCFYFGLSLKDKYSWSMFVGISLATIFLFVGAYYSKQLKEKKKS
ncbi:hypothetical protein [Priestia megaterium]|uniref:hypothetical protein n=1 Tax=Priestia megaterium TaxID=1404 RepID=UPI0031017D74